MPFAIITVGKFFKVVNTATGRTKSKHTDLGKAEFDMRYYNDQEDEKHRIAAYERMKADAREEGRREVEALRRQQEAQTKA